jgi:hypothetical protein
LKVRRSVGFDKFSFTIQIRLILLRSSQSYVRLIDVCSWYSVDDGLGDDGKLDTDGDNDDDDDDDDDDDENGNTNTDAELNVALVEEKGEDGDDHLDAQLWWNPDQSSRRSTLITQNTSNMDDSRSSSRLMTATEEDCLVNIVEAEIMDGGALENDSTKFSKGSKFSKTTSKEVNDEVIEKIQQGMITHSPCKASFATFNHSHLPIRFCFHVKSSCR